jgi:hypothetical protein
LIAHHQLAAQYVEAALHVVDHEGALDQVGQALHIRDDMGLHPGHFPQLVNVNVHGYAEGLVQKLSQVAGLNREQFFVLQIGAGEGAGHEFLEALPRRAGDGAGRGEQQHGVQSSFQERRLAEGPADAQPHELPLVRLENRHEARAQESAGFGGVVEARAAADGHPITRRVLGVDEGAHAALPEIDARLVIVGAVEVRVSVTVQELIGHQI